MTDIKLGSGGLTCGGPKGSGLSKAAVIPRLVTDRDGFTDQDLHFVEKSRSVLPCLRVKLADHEATNPWRTSPSTALETFRDSSQSQSLTTGFEPLNSRKIPPGIEMRAWLPALGIGRLVDDRIGMAKAKPQHQGLQGPRRPEPELVRSKRSADAGFWLGSRRAWDLCFGFETWIPAGVRDPTRVVTRAAWRVWRDGPSKK